MHRAENKQRSYANQRTDIYVLSRQSRGMTRAVVVRPPHHRHHRLLTSDCEVAESCGMIGSAASSTRPPRQPRQAGEVLGATRPAFGGSVMVRAAVRQSRRRSSKLLPSLMMTCRIRKAIGQQIRQPDPASSEAFPVPGRACVTEALSTILFELTSLFPQPFFFLPTQPFRPSKEGGEGRGGEGRGGGGNSTWHRGLREALTGTCLSDIVHTY